MNDNPSGVVKVILTLLAGSTSKVRTLFSACCFGILGVQDGDGLIWRGDRVMVPDRIVNRFG
jgi:hypothetical protein